MLSSNYTRTAFNLWLIDFSILEHEMKKPSLLLTCVCVALTLATHLAQAQGHDRNGRNDQVPIDMQRGAYPTDRHGPQNYKHRQERDHRSDRYNEGRFDQRNERWNDRSDYYNARGPEFRRGAPIPRQYYNPNYFVSDYRPHHLPPPPRNHRWVQVGTDYVLVAIATGIIANIILNQ